MTATATCHLTRRHRAIPDWEEAPTEGIHLDHVYALYLNQRLNDARFDYLQATNAGDDHWISHAAERLCDIEGQCAITHGYPIPF